MSTIYGLAASANEDYLLCTVDPVTGAWNQVGVPITLTGPFGYIPVGLMWNPDNLTMYLTAVEIGSAITNLYTLDLLTQVATFQLVIDLNTGISNGFIRGLSYDNVNNEVYCVSPRDHESSLNTTYRLDLQTGDLTLLGSPPYDNAEHSSTLFTNSGELFGLAIDQTGLPGIYQMYTIDTNDGTWTPTSNQTGLFPVGPFIAGDPEGAATVFDPTTNQAYGAVTISVDMVTLVDTYVIDLSTGAWTFLGNTGIMNPQAMTVVENICLAADTKIQLASGQQKAIADIREGDVVVDFKGRPTVVERNVMTGHARQFVRIPKNAFGENQPSETLLIRRGHPLLINYHQVPGEALIGQFGIDDVKLDKDVAIFTLVTIQQTFIQMSNISIGTWSSEGFRTGFLKHQSIH
jgi:hypothetical protein